MKYEPEMNIIFDVLQKTVLVQFRGKIVMLPGPFSSYRQAVGAGEAYCRRMGWCPDNDAAPLASRRPDRE